MRIEITIGTLQGSITAPASKSITHRLFVMGALSGKDCLIRNPLFCDDTEITLLGLKKLGFEFEISSEGVHFLGNEEAIRGTSPIEIDVGNSGTSARFLTALAALLPGKYRIDGTARMRQRPMTPLLQALQKLGAEIEHQNGHLPLTIRGGSLTGGIVEIDTALSSQFLSALLLIAPYLVDDTTIHHGESISSKPYSDMTVNLMKKAGIQMSESEGKIGYQIKAGQSYEVGEWVIEGDFSNAANFMVGAAISGGEIVVENLFPDSIQGDQIILEILQSAGADVTVSPERIKVIGGELTAIDWDMRHYPDLVPVVAVGALFARGISRLRNIANLRLKESDRLDAITANIRKLSGRAYLEENSLVIEPGPLQGAILPSYNDHRIAMSFAMVGLRVSGVEIQDAECVRKSYPNFWDNLLHLLKEDSI